MRAAVVTELGRPPEVRDLPEPRAGDGEALVELLAVPLNPIDITVGSGIYYGGHPELPYVPGVEAVGRVVESARFEPGTIVWTHGYGVGVQRHGLLAERAAVAEEALVAVPEGAEPPLAAALGVAGLAGWLPLAWRAKVDGGERVLVLGATGAVGLVAVQAAKLLGAARVVAAGRRPAALERAREAGADAVVALDGDGDPAPALRDALGGEDADIVVDPLWGEPLAAALGAAAHGARIVNIGQSAGPEATIPSAAVRGKQLDILGYSNFGVPRDVLEREYRRLVSEAIAGRIWLEIETVPLAEIAAAWDRQRAGPGVKLVVVP
jgi:NADPH:quinone reductase-like Zn-dependent oxidoreductase